MPASRRTFALAVAVLLAAPVMGAPQARQGPPKVGEMLKLPESVWTNINRFVFLVAFDVYGSGITKVPYEHPPEQTGLL